jgi:FKBP-type peptidyl-prolyl cis-trans isomerase SlpA
MSNPSTVQAQSFLTLHYRLSGVSGDVVNTFGGLPATLTLGTGELSPALEAKLLGLTEGAHQSFDLAAGAAYGERNPQMLQWVTRQALSKLSLQAGERDHSCQVGDVLSFPTPDGTATYAGAVVEVQADRVLFDFNHPLAGQAVRFEAQIIGVL